MASTSAPSSQGASAPAAAASPAPAAAAGGGGAANFIGALISLISRSDIRYQGLLAQIDPGQATVALEKVRSWGTEGRLVAAGRPGSEEIPPNDNVYDYIVFRAADVKDLKIDDPNPPRERREQAQPGLTDPAILGSSAPPGRFGGGFGQPPPPGAPGQFSPAFGPPGAMYGMPPGPPGPPGPFGHPPPGGLAGHNAPYGPFGGVPPPPPPHMQGPGQSFGQQPPPQQQQQRPQPSPSQPSATPAAAPAKSPAQKAAPAAPTPKDASGAAPSAAKGQANGAAASSAVDKIAEDVSKLSVASEKPISTPPTAPSSAQLPPIPRAAAAAAAAQQQHLDRRGIPGSGGRPRRHDAHHDGLAGPVPVPTDDYDFESANAKFKKEGIDASPATTPSAVSANPSAGGGGLLDAIPPPPKATQSFYDKSSFFDDISSEVKERYERRDGTQVEQPALGGYEGGGRGRGRGGGRGRSNRLAEERKNLATFGDTGSALGGGGYGGRGGRRGRGRGGYRGRGGGGGGPGAGGPAYGNGVVRG